MVILLIPWALAPVANAVLWKWIYNANYGILNAILLQLGVIDQKVVWLGDPFRALNMMLIADAWKAIPFITLLLLAGLQNVPNHLYRAARVDGAGTWARFRHVTLPGLRVPLLVAIVLQSIWALKVFDLVFVLTKGGPADGTRRPQLPGLARDLQLPGPGLRRGHRQRALRAHVRAGARLRACPGPGAPAAKDVRGVSARCTRLRRPGHEPAPATPPLDLGCALRAARLPGPGHRPHRLGHRHEPDAHQRADAVTAGPVARATSRWTTTRDVLVTRGNLPDALIDSAIVATLTAVLSLVLGSAAAYALARLRVPGANKILLAVLATQMFPGIVIAIPLFIVFSPAAPRGHLHRPLHDLPLVHARRSSSGS